MNKEILLTATFCMFPTFLMYYLSDMMIDRINKNNQNLNKIILLEEKISQLENKIEDLEEFKTSYYQNSFISSSWDNSSEEDM